MSTFLFQADRWGGVAGVAEFGLNWLIQSTLLLATGLLVGWMLQRRGSAVQSAVYRMTLVAVLVCPLVAWMLHIGGVSGFSVALPAAWTFRSEVDVPSVAEGRLLPEYREGIVARVPIGTAERKLPTGLGLNPESHQHAGVPWPEAPAISGEITAAPIRQPGRVAASTSVAPTRVLDRLRMVTLVVCLVWLMGMTTLLLRLASAWRQLSQIRRSATESEPATTSACGEGASLLRIAAPQVKHSPYLPSPCLAGVHRPVVLLPESLQGLSVRNVLIHELAHLRRRDCHWQLLTRLATAVFFFQPLLWKLSRRLDATAEEVCDDYVVQFGGDRQEYAHRLVSIAALSSTPVAAAAVGIVSFKSMLARRVARITEPSRSLSTRVGTLLLVLVLAGGLITTTAAGLVGLETQASGEDTTSESAARHQATGPEKNVHAGGDHDRVVVHGRVVDRNGKAVAGAHVVAIALPQNVHGPDRFSSHSKTLGETTTAADGHYTMNFPRVSARYFGFATVVARSDGQGVAWQRFNLAAAETEASFTLPNEERVRGRCVDVEGRPAGHVKLSIRSVRAGGAAHGDSLWGTFAVPSAAWLPSVVSDAEGRFMIRGVPTGHGIRLNVVGDERFAPQDLLANSGRAEKRGELDGTYRSHIKNVVPGEEAVFTLAAARFFEGVVRYADTGAPVPNAQVSAWASQQEHGGSMSSVGVMADTDGRYRICPEPGVRFGLMAYPPSGEPYLIREIRDLRWPDDATTQTVGLTLPRGVLVRGTIVETGTSMPIAGATVQYVPERKNNPHVRSETVTGWQGIQLSDEHGRYAIAALPGPGRLIVHGPTNDYVIQESSSRQLSRGTLGGPRVYAHCIEKIEPEVDAEPLELNHSLERGPAMTGELVDEQGEPVAEATMITRLNIYAFWLEWMATRERVLGGRFRIAGLPAGTQCPVHFLDAKRRLGATIPFKAGADDLRVVLKTCGQATMRFVDLEGEPVAGFTPHVQIVVTPGVNERGSLDWLSWNLGMPMADADFISNSDLTNYSTLPRSDEQGKLTLPALIPGATYRVNTRRSGQANLAKTIAATSGETVDLGDLVVDRPE